MQAKEYMKQNINDIQRSSVNCDLIACLHKQLAKTKFFYLQHLSRVHEK